MELTERSNERLVFAASDLVGHPSTLYLGCICSAERNVVYYVNESRPLP